MYQVVPLPNFEWPRRKPVKVWHKPIVSRGLSLTAMYEKERKRLAKEARKK